MMSQPIADIRYPDSLEDNTEETGVITLSVSAVDRRTRDKLRVRSELKN